MSDDTTARDDALAADQTLAGPALLVQEDTTIAVPEGFAGSVDGWGNLHLFWQGVRLP